MSRLSWLLSLVAAAACTGDGSGSGVDSTKKLYALSASDMNALCGYRIGIEHGPRTVECNDMSSVVLPGKGSCIAEVTRIGVQCEADVGDAEDCFRAEAKDPCTSRGACSAYYTCIVTAATLTTR